MRPLHSIAFALGLMMTAGLLLAQASPPTPAAHTPPPQSSLPAQPSSAPALLPIPRTLPIPGSRAGFDPRFEPMSDPANGILADTPPAPTSAPTKPAFVIGVFSQPLNSIGVWKARGINTMVRFESQGNSVKLDDYTGACAQFGIFMIREPRANIRDDLDDPYLLAWMHEDEPDIKNPPVDPARLAKAYKRMKDANKDMPVFVNVSGGNVLFKKTPKSIYQEYFKASDWIGNDFYPVTGWNQPGWIFRVGELVDILTEWSGGKPQIVFIETSAQHLSWTPRETRGVTPDELRAEIWESVLHGAKGIVYFPQQIGGGFQYDTTPIAVAGEMAQQNQRLAQLGPVLASPMNPKPIDVVVNDPLEAGWRRTSDGTTYLIILNHSNELQRRQGVKITGINATAIKDVWEPDIPLTIKGNVFAADFRPLEVKVYAVTGR